MRYSNRSRALVVIAGALLALIAGSPAVGSVREPPAAVQALPGHYQIWAADSSMRLEVALGSTGFQAIIQATAASTYQPSNWRFVEVGVNLYQIVNRNSGLCLHGGEPSVRMVIYQNSCGSGNVTHWTRTIRPNGRSVFTNRVTNFSLCIIGDLTWPGVPLVSDSQNSSCVKEFRLVAVS